MGTEGRPDRRRRPRSAGTLPGRLAWTTAALLSAAACAAPPAGPGERPTLLPDLGGPPRVVAVSANSARRATLRNADLVTTIVNSLPAPTGVFILTNDRQAFTLARNDRPERIRFVDLPFENPITIWTQDPFLVLTGPRGATTLLTSREFERADDRMMADALARAGDYRVQASRLFFEGGNIVSDREHAFIGANTIRRNALQLDVPESEVVLRFEEELGRRVLVVGPVPQPVAHIDMLLTPIGDRRIVVGDATAGARIAAQALSEQPAEVAAFEGWCEDHFFGDPSIREMPGADGPLTAPEVRGRTGEMIERTRAMAPLVDHIARSLAQHGYRVERVPFLFGGPEVHPPDPAGTRAMQAAYPMLTYNNVLIDEEAGQRRVYLPRYGWPAMDDAARRAWEALGFATRPVDGLAVSAMYGGALRCALKVLAR